MSSVNPQPVTTEAAIAVLYERMEHVIRAVEALSDKLDDHNAKRTKALADLEARVEHIERTMDRARWFLMGIAAAGGALGGGVAGMVVSMMGG